MTPYEIGILLHYFCRPDDHNDLIRNPPIWRPTLEGFLRKDLLRRAVDSDHVYEITERGRFYVEHGLCAAPLPVQKWEIPQRAE